MADATYALKVDLNRDFDFSDADEDLSGRLMGAHFFNGFANIYDPTSRDSTAEFLLDNRDARLAPEVTGAIAGLDNGKTATFEMTSGGTARLFTGWVDKPVPDTEPFGEQTAKLLCNSWVTRAGRTKNWLVPMQRNKRVDQIIPELIDRTGCFPPGLSSLVWLLDVAGMSELDVSTYLSDSSAYFTAETGAVNIARIGNKWTQQTNLYQAIKEVVGREGVGRLFLGRDGKLNFWNRDHLFLDTTVDQTFNESHPVHDWEYEYASLMYNSASVRYSNSYGGSASEILAVNNTEIILGIGETKSITYRYADQSSGVPIGGENPLAPVLGTDYVAYTGPGRTGSIVTSGVPAAVNRDGSTGSEVKFTNTNAFPVYIAAGSQLQGTRINDSGDQSMLARNSTDISQRGIIEWIHPAVVEGADFAQSLASYFLGIGSTPRGYFRSFTLNARASAAYMSDVMNLKVGSLVSLAGPRLNSTPGLYFIISEEHWISANPSKHIVKYKTEPAGGYAVWLLDQAGYSELGTTTVLAPW